MLKIEYGRCESLHRFDSLASAGYRSLTSDVSNYTRLSKFNDDGVDTNSYRPSSDTARSKHDVLWMTEQATDKIARFDPKTETWTEYSLPIVESDARRIEVDPNNPNRICWSGDTSNNLGYVEVF